MTNLQQLDENYNADLMDAMADRLAEQQEAMRETDPGDWMGYDEAHATDVELKDWSKDHDRN